MKKILLLATLLYVQFSYAQYCNVVITPPANPVDCGDCFTLTAVGSSFTIPLDASFNGGALGPGWTSNVSIMYNNPCGPPPDGSAAAWFGLGSQPRKM